MKRLWTRAHALVYRLSGGRLLARMGGQPVLLLRTVGRRTGRSRTTPVQYLQAGASFVVVAANAGAACAPGWYLNLTAAPSASARVGTRDFLVLAREADDAERNRLWEELTAANPYLEGTARKAGRAIPVLVLTPTGQADGPG